jgi:hypothetical protein
MIINDYTFEPIICDGCLYSVMGSQRTDKNRADKPADIPNLYLRDAARPR